MGIDVLLLINEEDISYLRASIRMQREKKLLLLLFPKEYWRGKALSYDFKGNYCKLISLTKKYLEESDDKEFHYCLKWINSVFDFFDLGIQKQEEGLNPKIYISW